MAEEQEKLELQTLDILRGTDDVERRLIIEMSAGVPSLSDMAYAIKIRVKEDYKIVGKVLKKRAAKKDPAYDVKRLRDIVGLRIVTLYRLDALRVIPSLLQKIESGAADNSSLFISGSIEEVVIYTTNPEGDAQSFVSRLQGIFESHGLKEKVRLGTAPSNYTSIHIVVWCRGKYNNEYRSIPVEIQVRTALEDVWGEIDHSLKYKRADSIAGAVPREDRRVDSIFAHLNVMKTLIDGVAQYADQIKIQLDEIDKANLISLVSRPAEDPLALLKPLPNLPSEIVDLVEEVVEKEKVALNPICEEETALHSLQVAREKLEEAKEALASCEELSAEARAEAEYVLDMERALVFYELGKRVESGANVLGEAEKIYHHYEQRYSNRALIHYRRGAVLDALGDRSLAMAKFREVGRLINQGNSELPEGHWIRSAWARFLGTLTWEEAHNLPNQPESGAAGRKERQLELFLDAFRITRDVYGLEIKDDVGGWHASGASEKAKAANNLLYFALEYIEAGGSEVHLNDAGFSRDDMSAWLRISGADDVSQMVEVSLVDTARRAFEFMGDGTNAVRAAKRVIELVPRSKADTMSRYHVEMVKDAEASLERHSRPVVDDPGKG